MTSKPWFQAALICGGLLWSTVPAHAGVLDFLFGKSPADSVAAPLDPNKRQWTLGEFTTLQIVASEPGGGGNQHPATWSADLVRQQLSRVRTDFRGAEEALFAADEIGALALPLSQALSLAKPGDDVLLLSTHRRDQGLLVAPFAVTARLFVHGDQLQLIVHDTRRDFMDAYIGTKAQPTFTFGSRAAPGKGVIRSEQAVSWRADWLSFPAVPAAVSATPPAERPTATPSPVPTPAPAAVAPAAAVPIAATKPAPVAQSPVAPAAPRPRDAAFADEVEQRLLTLKRLRDKGLISEAEYQQMRKDVLQLL